ncbi:GNAT family N-acetyltransferase [Streptococcus ratti]|uniref:GNAT family N-acetyltransferase n=1 Tax=Streptococcus ratti TaxID=1341 RepID=A0A7X9LFD0_STRRT|nr:GNAT family N-acetyltransferase [Streptococcus ratti]NMD48830.1 GNAT family N-acetyltransferase [Streptococcus ratti]
MKIKQTRDTLSTTYLDAVKIRNIVFVQGQGVPLAIEVDKDEAHCIHFVLYDDNDKPLATCRLLPNQQKDSVTLQRMAVLDSYQGLSLGRKILQAAEKFAKEQGFKKVTLHAQMGAYNFYAKNGYTPVGERFLEAGIGHIIVEKIF